MEIMRHARISQCRWGGTPEDYLAIHRLIDSTKEVCSDNRHRVFHTTWAVKQLVVPIFGETFQNSEGRWVDIKALCERDHLLIDFRRHFIPTLSDFVEAYDLPVEANLPRRIERFHRDFVKNTALSACMLSPLSATGRLCSLLITHNSWFLNEIAPRLGGEPPRIMDFDLTPALFFNALRFEAWMDNGFALPPSARKLNEFVSSARTGTARRSEESYP